MPLQRCKGPKGEPGWQFGDAGACYLYTQGDGASEKAARQKAVKQALAIGDGKVPAEGLSELYRLAEAAVAGQRLPMMLFPLGTFKSAKYPKLPLTRELADALIANFEGGVLGTEPVVDSSGNHDESTQAAGWIKRVYVASTQDGGEALFADWEPTDLGAELLNSQRYRYNSVHIDAHVDNTSGERIPNVLKGATLCNTPVLRMLPPVLEAGDSIAASEPVEVALSELTAADDDPVAAALDEMDAIAARLDELLKGKRGMPSWRTLSREARAKISVHTLSESFNDQRKDLENAIEAQVGRGCWVEDFDADAGWVVFTTYGDGIVSSQTYRADYSGEGPGITVSGHIEVESRTTYVPKSQPATGYRATEQSPSATAEIVGDGAVGELDGAPQRKEKRHMSELTELLKLSEGADEPLILAEVQKIDDERVAALARADAAEAKLTEGEQAERARLLDEAIAATEVLPAEKDSFLKLAEAAPAIFSENLAARKGRKLLDTAEHGSGKAPEQASESADVTIATRAIKLAEEKKIGLDEATALVFAADPALQSAYIAHTTGRGEA